MKVLAVVEDLMFRSRIEAHLSRLAVPYRIVPPRDLPEALQVDAPTHIVVNLAEMREEDLAHLQGFPGRVLGFGPHVDRERFLAARRTGAQVVANSALEVRLDAWVSGEGA